MSCEQNSSGPQRAQYDPLADPRFQRRTCPACSTRFQLVTKGRLPEVHFGTVCPQCGVNLYCNRQGVYVTKRLNVQTIPSTLKLIDRSIP